MARERFISVEFLLCTPFRSSNSYHHHHHTSSISAATTSNSRTKCSPAAAPPPPAAEPSPFVVMVWWRWSFCCWRWWRLKWSGSDHSFKSGQRVKISSKRWFRHVEVWEKIVWVFSWLILVSDKNIWRMVFGRRKPTFPSKSYGGFWNSTKLFFELIYTSLRRSKSWADFQSWVCKRSKAEMASRPYTCSPFKLAELFMLFGHRILIRRHD